MVRLTRAQVREIDRRAIEEYHIPGIVLMENAASGAAGAAFIMLDKAGYRKAMIVCGGGNNGGDGLAMARLLHNLRIKVMVALMTDPQKYRGDALINWQIVQSMKLPVMEMSAKLASEFTDGIFVDAIFGTGLTAPPRSPFAAIARAINARGLPVLAIDIPSGLDCDSGMVLGEECIKASHTVTFVASKTGFESESVKPYVGKVHVVAIGCPRELIEEVSRSNHQSPDS